MGGGFTMNEIERIKKALKSITAKLISLGYKPTGLYQYKDIEGNLLYVRFRLDHPTEDKYIRPLSRDKKGNWNQIKEPTFESGKPIYNLHLIAKEPDKLVFIVEGEKCANALRKLGILATTSGGSATAKDANWQILDNRNAVLWPDNDESGKQYADDVTAMLEPLNAKIQRIDTTKLNLPPKGDCVDWIEQFKQIDGRLPTVKDIEDLQLIDAEIQAPINNPNHFHEHNNLPEPLPNLPEVMQFDYDYLPDGLRPFVKDISERMQCPPDFAAVGVMVMVGSLIGRKVGVRPMRHDNWTVIPNLWGAVVGNSGVMKSPTLSAVLSPIERLQAEAIEQYNNAKSDYEANKKLSKVKQSAGIAKAKELLKEDINADVKGLFQSDFEDVPLLKRYITNNASYEALGELLMENPNGILVESDEIIGLLKQLDATGQEPARAFYLTGADGVKPYTFDRITRGKGLHIPAVCLSVMGGIQPGVLADYVKQATSGGAGADGLLQRFGLMVYPDISPTWKEVDRFPDAEAKKSVNQLVNWLNDLNPLIHIKTEDDDYSLVPYLRFDDDAQVLFSEWRGSLEHRIRSGEEHHAIVSHLAKYRNLIPSLALINHLCEYGKGPISAKSLLRAIAYAEYLESHARRIYSSATRPDLDAAKTLLNKLSSNKLSSPFKARDVYRKCWTGLESPQKTQTAINLLIEYNQLIPEEVSTEGRPTIFYHLNLGGK
jgi:hypothetical protein